MEAQLEYIPQITKGTKKNPKRMLVWLATNMASIKNKQTKGIQMRPKESLIAAQT